MRNVRMTILVMGMFCVLLAGEVLGLILDDGQTHNIDWLVSGHLDVGDDVFFGRPTIVNLLSDGSIEGVLQAHDNSQVTILGGSVGRWLYAYDNSQVTISGGSIGYSLQAYDNSQVTISGGSISLQAYDNSQVTILGGSIEYSLNALGNSQVTISGGSIEYSLNAIDNSQVTISGGSVGDDIYAGSYDPSNESTITFVGSNFAINGVSVGYGEYDTMGQNLVHATLTGTLASGDHLNNGFYIYTGSTIVLAPGPFVSSPYCAKNIVGDLNNDCRVDFADLAKIAENWMTCNLEPQSACWQ